MSSIYKIASKSYAAKRAAEEYWRENLDPTKFHMPTFAIDPETGYLTSDLQSDGYPPRRSDADPSKEKDPAGFPTGVYSR